MARSKAKFSCYLLSNENSKDHSLIEILDAIMKEVGGDLRFQKNRKELSPYALQDIELNEISKSNLILIENTNTESEIYYGLGLAHALGKPVIPLIQKKLSKLTNQIIPLNLFFLYDTAPTGIEKFKVQFKTFIVDYIKNPNRFQKFFPYSKKNIELPYVIDLDKLEPREYENLCFELISQMGFKKVSWGTEIKDIDLIATFPKKDPDGFEYQELWLIITGNKGPAERFLEMAVRDPEYLYERLMRTFDSPDLFSKNMVRSDTPITVLFMLNEHSILEGFDRMIDRAEMRLRYRKTPVSIRIRTWDSAYITKLIQAYPQVAFKYFSEESKIRSKYRKTPEELYNENIKLTEQVLSANAIIEEEKRKRFIAERETAWRDVAFKAAHKLGNPVDATDTYLQSLKRKLNHNEIAKAKIIADEMDITIEEAKAVIGQFKSLTKIEEINVQSCDIASIIRHSCKTAEEQGVNVKINIDSKLPNALVDPVRMTECFNELVANSLHWFNKDTRTIFIDVKKIDKTEMPEPLDSQKLFLKVIYQDNGLGVISENKEKIFSPFFSTYQHGTGLGLSLLKKIIELQEGWVIECGKPGEGARFEIYLPIAN